MKECPVCKKKPPKGQEWRDYEAHVQKCATKFYEDEKAKKSDYNRIFEDIFGDFFK